ncbi:ligand-binding sensor domain-containing diguanylate cyclase [Massilia pseudoviolaceinigra]|uniref:ligand-binding sensor domain-containing diguanylate cyclase n=1 Tax=Massilia pseudoviolaceinigra TaxID=3057165 RepID=UPI0027967B97|nr:ligand-binding sensor domain-containing diguanylate cyclase [Massilia sp. CCM 9206]MDQ1919242.1 diguanylate cyclase [Massilia sp. CCM 9206]
MRHARVLVGLCFLWFTVAPAQADLPAAQVSVGTTGAAGGLPKPRFTYRSYGAEHGLNNVGVLRLVQDRQGFIWAGTEDGLYRYDGYRFDGFGLKEGLPSTVMTALLEDASGVLWAGTHGGLARYDGQRFMPVKASAGLPAVSITGLAHAKAELLVATAKGPYRGDIRSGFSPLAHWPGGEATAILQSKASSSLWIGRWDGDAHMLAWRDGRWHDIPVPAGKPDERVDALAEDGEGRIWARTPTSLWLLRADGSGFDLAATPIPLVSSRGYLATGKRGDLYVSTDHGLLHRTGGHWEITSGKNGLPGAPWPVLEDREGSLWIGSVGLHRLLGRGILHAYTTSEGLPYDVVWNIFRDRDQRLMVGTSHGLAVSDGAQFRTIKGTEDNMIRSIVQAADGSIFLAGVPGNEILRYTPSTGALMRQIISAGNPAKRTFRLLAGRDGAVWASTDGAGLWRADSGAAQLHFEQVVLPGGTSSEYISDVRDDAHGRVWVAAQNGPAVLENGKWRRFTAADGLRSSSVSYIVAMRNGDFLLPYFDPLGVARVRYENDKLHLLKHYDAASTQSADKVFLAGEDALGRIWLGGGQGIDLLTPQGSRHFGATEGLIGDDTAAMAFLAEKNGDAWFGTTKGLVRFDQKAFAALPVEQPLRTTLLRTRIGGVDYPAAASGVRVAPDNTFEVRFTGLSFVGEGKIQYRERLLGRETAFNITDSRDARYSGLAHGNYRFEVSARIGPNGAWGPASSFAFQVMPAWWQTWWLRAIAAIGTLLLLMLGYRWRVGHMRDENVRLENLVAARTEDLQQANAALRESSMVDPLTGLKNRRFLSVLMPEELARTMRQHRFRELAADTAVERNIDLCLLMVDLDHFKLVNDEHGHAAGDSVLRQIADVMRRTCRASDVVVRWGGEEFLIVARNTDRDHAHALANQVCQAVRSHRFDLGNGVVLQKSCSVGFTAFPLLPGAPERFDWEQALELADQCLYAAKNSGRDGWVGCLPQLADSDERVHMLPVFGPCIVLSSWNDGRQVKWH